MDVLTRYLNKIAYKFPKGYPDITDGKDIYLLDYIIREQLGEEFSILNENDAEEGIAILKKQFNFTDKDFQKVSGKRYKVLVPRAERFDYAQKMDAIEGFEFDPNAKGSSMGAVTYKGASFLLKPSGAQGRASAGTENEDILENGIKQFLVDGPKNVVFVGRNKNYVAKNVSDVVGVGYDVAGGKKADVVLKGDTDYPISIKKDNAGFWESSDSRYRDVVKKLSDKIKNGELKPLTFKPFQDKLGNVKEGINVMYNEDTGQKVTGVIVTDLPNKDEESIIFGSDNAVVVYKSYTPKDITLEGDIVKVDVSFIIEDLNDVEEFNLEPVLNIRHDSTRKATGGLRATVVPEKLIYKNGKLTGGKVELSYNEIMK